MDLLKEFFEGDGEKTQDAFNKWLKEKNIKLADLSKGEYIAASKAIEAEKKAEKKLADELAAKEAALKEEFAKKEAEYAAKDKEYNELKTKADSTLTESEKQMKAMQAQFENQMKELQGQLDKQLKAHDSYEKKMAKLEEEGNAAKLEAKKEKAGSIYLKMNGNPDFAELAVEKWLKGEGELSEIAEKFKEENPAYFTKPETKTVSTTPDLTGGKSELTDVQKSINRTREAAGLAPKWVDGEK